MLQRASRSACSDSPWAIATRARVLSAICQIAARCCRYQASSAHRLGRSHFTMRQHDIGYRIDIDHPQAHRIRAQPLCGHLTGLHRGRNIACRQLRESQWSVGKAFDETPQFGRRTSRAAVAAACAAFRVSPSKLGRGLGGRGGRTRMSKS